MLRTMVPIRIGMIIVWSELQSFLTVGNGLRPTSVQQFYNINDPAH